MALPFLPLTLALVFGGSPARADDAPLASPASAETVQAADTLVGSDSAAQKRKGKQSGNNSGNKGAGKKASKGGPKSGSPQGGQQGGNGSGDKQGGSGSGGQKSGGGQADQSPSRDVQGARGSSGSEQGRQSDSRPGESREASSAQRQAAPEGASRQSAERSPSSGDPARATSASRSGTERPSVRTSTVHAGSPGQASPASAERRASTTHKPANYRGSTRSSGHAAASTGSAERHRASTKAHAVARSHHQAASRHRAYATHHAAWVRHHGYPGPSRWWHPWSPGRPYYWYHGVFVYGPPVVVYDSNGGGHVRGEGEVAAAPKRAVDREGKFSLGVRGGSYLSGFHDGSSYGDAGLGLAARYRPVDALGLEVQWMYNDATWSQGTARIHQPLSVTAELFAFPWTKVNPYVLAGVTFTDRNIDQPLAGGASFASEDALWGPTGGLGIEFGLGKDVSLNLDVRGIGYVNKGPDDPARAGAVQANAGLNFYF